MKPDLRTDDMTLNALSPKYLADLLRQARKAIFRVAWFVSIAVILPTFCGDLHAFETSQPLTMTKMNLATLQSAFNGVNLLDAEVALKVFGQTMGKINGYDIEVSMHTFRYARDILSGPLAGKIDIVLLDSWSYLEIEQTELFEPALLSSEQGQVANRYLLLTRGKAGFKSLTDLRGRKLNLLTASNALLGIPWLQTLLLEQHLGKPEDFFGKVHYQSDPMPTILQVFFGKMDAALIDAKRFELMTELNPQLNRMRAIETSEPFVSFIVCLKRSGWSPPRLKQEIIDIGKKLHLEPKAQQAFTLFKFGRLVPFEYGQLDSVRRLRQRTIAAENQNTTAPGSLNEN